MTARPARGILPNLVNGVSQQAPSLRLPSQCDAQDNFYPTIVEGLKDRPPTEMIAKLPNTTSNVFSHIINRDGNERYVVIYDGTAIEVYDFAGNAKTVNAPNGYGYLTCDNPADDIRALTIADYTFVLNRTKQVAMAASPVAAARPYEALVNVMAGNYGMTYQIIINGVVAASVATSTTDVHELDTNYIASALYTQLATNGYTSGPWMCGIYSNAIHIQNSSVDFSITATDGQNNSGMVAVKGETEKFADLPTFGPPGFVIKVSGDQQTSFDDYWVTLVNDDFGQAIWKECVAPGTPLNLNADTMPFTLVREADGSFTFKQAAWDTRVCGDATSSPDPSFVGHTLNELFFHKDRFGILANENVILSRTGSFFNFFRTSCTAVLDDDPIDVGATHTKVSILQNVMTFQGDLIVNSGQTQFRLAGNETLTPKTVSLLPLTEFVTSDVRPVGLGTWCYFTARRGDWESVWEYTTDKVSATSTANEVTSHCPVYIPAGAFHMAGTSNESLLAVLTHGDPSAVYAYRYYWSGEQKLQSAWGRWSFPGVTKVLNAAFIQSELYLVMQRSDGVYIEKMRVQPNVTDTGLEYLIHLDRRVSSDYSSSGFHLGPVYDPVAKTTTYALPYTPTSDIHAVSAPGGSVSAGREVPVVSVDVEQVTIKGDTRTWKLYFGYTYERRYRFSPIYDRQMNPQNPYGGGTVVSITGRLQLMRLTVAFNRTTYFRFEVTPEGRETYVHTYTGRVLGKAANTLGGVPVVTGKRTFPVFANSETVKVELVNDSWMPSSFLSAEWFGRHSSTPKS